MAIYVYNLWLPLGTTHPRQYYTVFWLYGGFMLADVVADALILECSQVGEDSKIRDGCGRTELRKSRGVAMGALAGSCL